MKIEFFLVYLTNPSINPTNSITAMTTDIKKVMRDERVAGVIKTISKLSKEYLNDCPRDRIMITIHNNDLDITEALLIKGVRSEYAMCAAIHTTNIKAVELLLKYGFIITPSHIKLAELYGWDDITELMNKINDNSMFQFDLEF